MKLPISNTWVPILLPTFYLWFVDTFALKRGTWVIEKGTKLDWHLWEGLDVEEAVFFLLTNVLIVFGLIAFDNAVAILDTFPALFSRTPALPSPLLLIQALTVRSSSYDDYRVGGLFEALQRLRRKSRSFYLASSAFPSRLRIDLILLYSFCRVADDLVDDAKTTEEARSWVTKLQQYLDIAYSKSPERTEVLESFIRATFPPSAQATLSLLPTSYLTSTPLFDLLKGFEMDLEFPSNGKSSPILDEQSLHTYGARVAGTVAESCLDLVYHHTALTTPESRWSRIKKSGAQMGIALQCVNIARDISIDAINGRVYIPQTWLKEVGLRLESVLESPESPEVEELRQRMLVKAMSLYDEAKTALDELPTEARGPMRVAVESYVEIGRVLRQPGYRVYAGRATVPKFRRLKVAWAALLRN